MKAIVQRVAWAEVEIENAVVGRIEAGLLVYVGVATDDTETDAHKLAEKVAHLRIFTDEQDKLNLSVRDTRGGVLAISNFTVMGDTRKGRRPSFVNAARPEDANILYESFVSELRKLGCDVETGVFRAMMEIRSAADGPVNVIIETT